ncbi:GLPGLI family protein [Flavihumibacter stibioxidans]|uniref:GLPGLI family protein n=1 Tax=Flavihumibacter stibioxidans TaxID=1834163 RepID=A0ABR7M376_9BACT|nr:GLPGLI family protein [Flavihumibacter stibioxidans]MBC6489469.1 hypothetical protein [Flavihumibacter stibioxidans]
MKKFILIAGLVFSVSFLQAQAVFISNGVIEYERKINVHRQFEMDEEQGEFFKEFIKRQPRFHDSYFNLSFTREKSIYKPGRQTDTKVEPWLIGPAKENIVLTDFNSQKYSSRKKVFEETFIVTDSLNKVQWKISNEFRQIAGFDCRKAVGIISDSVYVVAFYTDEIPVSGGPESFGGLPGMILGLAVPRLYSTWFATKVELNLPPASVFTINDKGKKIDAPQMAPMLKSSFSDWGKRGEKFTWWSLL